MLIKHTTQTQRFSQQTFHRLAETLRIKAIKRLIKFGVRDFYKKKIFYRYSITVLKTVIINVFLYFYCILVT